MDSKKENIEEELPAEPFLTLVEWSAPEYEHHEKTSDWYWAVGIIAIGFLAIAFILKNFLFGILVLVGGFAFALFGAKKPKLISFSVTSRGLKIEKRLFPFDSLDHFWIHYDPPHKKELYIISKKLFVPQISIPLGFADPNEIREHLLKFVEEKEIEEPFSQAIAKFLKF